MHKQNVRDSQVAQWNPPANAGEVGSIPVSGRSPGEGNDHPLQYSCLGNPRDRGAWWATAQGAAELDTPEHTHTPAEMRPTHPVNYSLLGYNWHNMPEP